MPKQCVKILFSPIFCFVKLLSYVCLRKRVGANSLREQSIQCIQYTYIYSSHLQAIPDNDVICRHPLACPVVDIHLVTDFVHTFAFSIAVFFWLTLTTIIIHISLSRNLNCDQQQSLIVVQNNYYSYDNHIKQATAARGLKNARMSGFYATFGPKLLIFTE